MNLPAFTAGDCISATAANYVRPCPKGATGAIVPSLPSRAACNAAADKCGDNPKSPSRRPQVLRWVTAPSSLLWFQGPTASMIISSAWSDARGTRTHRSILC